MPTTAPLSVDELTALLGPGSCWGPIRWRASTGSTNQDAAALIKAGGDAGLVVLSEHQAEGRGRFAREWRDTPGTSVACSAVVAPRPAPPMWGWLSLLVGLAVREGVERYTHAGAGRVTLKWPNDVLVDGRKVCGILCERAGDLAVLGWGLNVCMDECELPVPTAGSLLLAGLPHDKTAVLAEVLASLQRWFGLWQDRGELRAEYEAACDTIGRQVNLHVDVQRAAAGVLTGHAVGVDPTGAILIERGGQVEAHSAGDVVHLR
ncbi:biotin--[acetyl-CoA-carboxylase] ligase [Propionibacterium cyclohexanicum]|uniref:biotin--[acetyl-CoA-carboxylase] ligase n=1 Tax=Propionibacterium cyclohexanicum TaxID=64702 RepID=UPI001FE02C14|nr:biotin--[acetyl-CoA-carboxylase] ligase [Propionibacterium cyclohexanicum]